MNRRSLVVLLTLALVLLGAALAAAETRRGRINAAGRVFTFIADTNQSTQVTLMWDLPATDIDFGVFDENGDSVAISLSSTDGLEKAEFGVISGVIYDVVLAKFRGPNSKFQLNVSTTDSEIVLAPGMANLRFVGDLDTLALEDERYARMRQLLEDKHALKSQAP